ncbi:TPA: GNAT family N-acetyltransferase [Pseudomonas putida]|uniref:acyl-homoserine-lactone synthase n=1 Tax=Pseudomonas TaxID=286 RepID=UPI00110CAD40|nr:MULTISPECIES: acyl-homoserine-lactone synthase [Pseudomonas]MDD1995085.1 GNAT family N-acetyltransferase [Pseudomonas putida]HDS0919398.1 GNAT family N-acetyltransferase [Pseudomonas putida]HDS0933786.1 GNAT family N-acetyltransferase [Pseudomonas putida]HDS1783898.1 GNAT family N-acetyltransferase [Pseudomonas putida]HDS3799700.1 GNAT family N-acetyltransferase [Pseudomonas putida]
MLEVIVGNRGQMCPSVFSALTRYRYEVFVEQMGWALPCAKGEEVDQFDRPDTVYVLARDASREIVGCARLIPTDRPFLLGEVFPYLMGDTPLPSSRRVWELSRFSSRRLLPRRVKSVQVWHETTSFVRSVMGVASALGAKRLIAFSAPGNERLLKRMGVSTQRIAQPQLVQDLPVVPFWIDIDRHSPTRA